MEANIKHVTIAIGKETSTKIQPMMRQALNGLTLAHNNMFIVAISRIHSQSSDGSCEKSVLNVINRKARNSNTECKLYKNINNNQRKKKINEIIMKMRTNEKWEKCIRVPSHGTNDKKRSKKKNIYVGIYEIQNGFESLNIMKMGKNQNSY